MRVVVVCLAMVAVASCSKRNKEESAAKGEPATNAPAKDESAATGGGDKPAAVPALGEHLDAVAKSLECSGDKPHPLCAIAKWEQGELGTLPEPGRLMGLSIELKGGVAPDNAFRDYRFLSTLVISKDGSKSGLKLVTLRHHNAPEYDVLSRIQDLVRTSMISGGGAVTIPAMVAQYLDKQTAGDAPTATPGAQGWTLAGGAEMRNIDGRWYVVENVSPTLRRISVFDSKTR